MWYPLFYKGLRPLKPTSFSLKEKEAKRMAIFCATRKKSRFLCCFLFAKRK
jgi:hypothetical protein